MGPHIAEPSGQGVALLETGALLEDVIGIIHAHPTLRETLPESALNALGSGLHG